MPLMRKLLSPTGSTYRTSVKRRQACLAVLVLAGFAVPAQASGAPGMEGVVVFILLIPAVVYLLLVDVLLLFRVFAHRWAVYASIVGALIAVASAAAAFASGWDLESQRVHAIPGAKVHIPWFAVVAAAYVAFGVAAPFMQYQAERSRNDRLRRILFVAIALQLAIPLTAWIVDEVKQAIFDAKHMHTGNRERNLNLRQSTL